MVVTGSDAKQDGETENGNEGNKEKREKREKRKEQTHYRTFS